MACNGHADGSEAGFGRSYIRRAFPCEGRHIRSLSWRLHSGFDSSTVVFMQEISHADRRLQPRYDAAGLGITVRAKGRLARLRGMVLDFNQHGLAVFLDQPLGKHADVYLTLQIAARRIENIVGVVHNCTAFSEGYRCGIQFRTSSTLQFDQDLIQSTLAALEQQFAPEAPDQSINAMASS